MHALYIRKFAVTSFNGVAGVKSEFSLHEACKSERVCLIKILQLENWLRVRSSSETGVVS